MAFTKPDTDVSVFRTQPDQIEGQATTVKGLFDSLLNLNSTDLVALIDELEAETGAASLGALASDGVTASTIQAELNKVSNLEGVTATPAEINVLDDITATTEELNLLHGATLSTAELNYVDGVTSAIQTQIDAKADKVTEATNGNFAALDTNGNLTDSGHKDADYADASHTHGDITAAGAVTSDAAIPGNGDYILITDSTETNKIQRGVAIGTGTTKYLREDGSFQTPPDTNTKVSQAASTANETHAVLLKKTTGTDTETETAVFDDSVTVNPSTGEVAAVKFKSTQATGTAPFEVASTTAVTNLNADKVDGKDAADFQLSIGATSGILKGDGAGSISAATGGTDYARLPATEVITGYAKAEASASLAATDTVNAALGKLEKKVDDASSGGVSSFNSRTGAVSPAASDYDAGQIDYDNVTSGLTATDVQAAIDEVLGEIPDTSGLVPNTRTINSNALSSDVTLDGTDIALTGYSKPGSTSAIAATDTTNEAVGKLEKGLDGKLALSGGTMTGVITGVSNQSSGDPTDTTGLRNILVLDADPTGTDGSNGDICIVISTS